MKTQKGSIFDVLFLVVILTVVAAAIIIVYMVNSEVYSALSTAGFNSTQLQPAEDSINAIGDWNVIFVFIYIATGIASIISAFAVRSHPVFFIVFFLVQVLTLALTPTLQDVYTAVANTTSMAAAAANFGYMTTTISMLPVLTLAISTLIAIAMFAIPNGGGGTYV
jgi:hypothetical protein